MSAEGMWCLRTSQFFFLVLFILFLPSLNIYSLFLSLFRIPDRIGDDGKELQAVVLFDPLLVLSESGENKTQRGKLESAPLPHVPACCWEAALHLGEVCMVMGVGLLLVLLLWVDFDRQNWISCVGTFRR
jgi:hypothetical protein